MLIACFRCRVHSRQGSHLSGQTTSRPGSWIFKCLTAIQFTLVKRTGSSSCSARTTPLRCVLPSSQVHISSIPTDTSQAPEVVFVKDESHPIPWHPHIYTNGIICLDLLDRAGWSPVHNVESVCVSLQSMLTSNTKKERPPGDDNFVKYNTQRPRDINFVFHDNQV